MHRLAKYFLIDWEACPLKYRYQLFDYVEYREPPTSAFILHMLEGHFSRAEQVGTVADRLNLIDLSVFIHKELPLRSWGDPDVVKAWCHKPIVGKEMA